MKCGFRGVVLISLCFCGAAANGQTSYCPAYLHNTWLDTEVTNMVNQLTSASASGLHYAVLGGSLSFPGLTTSSCYINGPNNPNPSACWGTYNLANRNSSVFQDSPPYYMLDKDEAVLFIGVAPPDPFYYGYQTYVYSRANPYAQPPLNPLVPTGGYVDIYASIGPAVNQLNAREVNPKNVSPLSRPAFGGQLAIISTANKTAQADIAAALPYLWSYSFTGAPPKWALTAANNITNIEKLPVLSGTDPAYIQIGSSPPSDQLQTVLRVIPLLDSGLFDTADYNYLSAPPACVLRISLSRSIPGVIFDLDDPMPLMQATDEATQFGNAVALLQNPPQNLALTSELAYIQQEVINYWTTHAPTGQQLQLLNIPGQGSPLWPSGQNPPALGWTMTGFIKGLAGQSNYGSLASYSYTEGRNCIDTFEDVR